MRAAATFLGLWVAGVLACGGSTAEPPRDDQPAEVAAEAAEPDVAPDLVVDTPSDPGPQVPVAPPGCPAYTTPPGGDIAEIRIDPPLVHLQVPFGGNSTVQFKAKILYKSGTPPVEITAGPFQLTDTAVGSIDNGGLFSTADRTGGETFVTLTMGGVCGSAYLRVIQSWIAPGDSGVADPGQAWVATGNPPEDAGIDLVYPPEGGMAPRDFPPISVQWTAPTGGDVGVVRFESLAARFDFLFRPGLHAAGGGFAVTLDADGWEKLFQVSNSPTYTVRVLLASLQDGKVVGPVRASAGKSLSLSVEKAGGAFYYWNTGGNGTIRYLEFGKAQSSVVKVAGGGCVGCHTIAPDASVIATNAFGMSMWPLTMSDPITGTVPSWIHADALAQFAMSNSIAPAFSSKYWTETDKRIVSPGGGSGLGGGAGNLFSIDLITGVVKTMKRIGDAGGPGFPTWSSQGGEVVYASCPGAGSSAAFAMEGSSKLYKVPYNDGDGGVATPLKGADEAGVLQYYPAFSPDGRWILYNRADTGAGFCPVVATGTNAPTNSTYDHCLAEVWVVPSDGGTAIRLDKANGPGAPGNANSWPTFGISAGQRYWIAFASRREYGILHTGSPPAPQIWIAAVDPGKLLQGLDGSYAALWLPNQELGSGNHIARWGTPLRKAR